MRAVFPGMAVILFCVVIELVARSEWGDYTEQVIARRLEFQVREKVRKSPELIPSIKVLIMDDASVARLGNPEISENDWMHLLSAIGRREPKAVFVDKIFSIATSAPGQRQDWPDLSGVPIYVAGNTTSFVIGNRKPLPLEQTEFQWQSVAASKLDWLQFNGGQPAESAYGPDPALLSRFKSVGHINYELHGRIRPLIRVGADAVFRHLSLYAAERVQIKNGNLSIDKTLIRPDQQGRIQVNFPALTEMSKKLYSIYPFVLSARKNQDKIFNFIEPGDQVLILPLFFTGNTDFRETPIGSIPVGLIHYSLLNSILQNDWLRPVPGRPVLIVLATALAISCALFAAPVFFAVASLCFAFLWVALGLYAFAWTGWVIPWLYPLVAFLCVSAGSLAFKAWQKDRTATTLQTAFRGLVSDDTMKDILKQPGTVTQGAQEVIASIMFLDIVGFSSMSAKESPAVIFNRLKALINRFAVIIHKHGGIIDKTLGDGLLAFFGHDYTGGKTTDNHADAAIRAAREIQQQIIVECAECKDPGMIMPLRIGINTANVYLGNLGSYPRIDFTIIGEGVNFAQRLESGCRPFMINVSQTTIEHAEDFHHGDPGIRKIQIDIKHFKEQLEVFEIDAGCDPEILKTALEKYENAKVLVRKYFRWEVTTPEKLKVTSGHITGRLVDYSRKGFSFLAAKKIPMASAVSFQMTGDQEFGETLDKNGIVAVRGVVRWCRESNGNFIHGIEVADLGPDQSEVLFTAFRRLFSKKSRNPARHT